MDETKSRLLTVSLLSGVLTLITVAAVCLKSSWIFFTILGISAVATLGILAWFAIQHRKLLSIGGISGDSDSCRKEGAGDLTKFRYEDLVLATEDFSSIVGRGGSGCVFRGTLKDGTIVAVKRMEGKEREEREFRTEVAAIGCVQHMNLVRLHGYCIVQRGPRFLVYDFVQNGSLDRWIFPQEHNYRKEPSGCLPWKVRYQVAIDVARALYYLHNDGRSRILHLDVKPENILLDDKYRALISDFGLAKLMGKEDNMVATRIRGTRGYLAPEWILEKRVSAKSDVYSYGVLLLEMIGGRRSVHMSGSDHKGKSTKSNIQTWDYFPKIVFDKLKAEKIMEVVDRRLLEEGTTIDENEVRRLICIALWCIQEKVKLRPNMGHVVNMLEGRSAVDEPPETKMFIYDLLSFKDNNQAHGEKPTLLQISQFHDSMDVASATTSSKYTSAFSYFVKK